MITTLDEFRSFQQMIDFVARDLGWLQKKLATPDLVSAEFLRALEKDMGSLHDAIISMAITCRNFGVTFEDTPNV